MRDLNELNRYRRSDWELRSYGMLGDRGNGCFVIPFGSTPVQIVHEGERQTAALVVELACIASTGGGWDHVSVSTRDRCPTWEEMSFVHRMFAKPGETWVQFHVPEREHVNMHPYCLHLWRKQSGAVSKPPSLMVGANVMRAMR